MNPSFNVLLRCFRIIVLVIAPISVSGQQENFCLKGTVIDSVTKKPLKNVNIYCKKLKTGASTNNNGEFQLKLTDKKALLTISHLGYEKKHYYFDASTKRNEITLMLVPRYITLKETTISSAKVVNIMHREPLFVVDYEFFEGNILFIAFPKKSLRNPMLIMRSASGDSLASTGIYKPKSLTKDCFDKNYLLTDNFGMEITFDAEKLQLGDPIDIESINETFEVVAGASENTLYLKQYLYNKQVLVYYTYDTETKKLEKFREISDEQGLTMLEDLPLMRAMPGYSEADERFNQMCFFRPAFAPLIVIDTLLYILNYEEGTIEFYTLSGVAKGAVEIGFPQHRFCKEEIITDPVSKKAYATFRKSGIYTLREVNLSEGTLGGEIKIPGFPFIEKIKVFDNTVYFLYKPNAGYEYKHIYRMMI